MEQKNYLKQQWKKNVFKINDRRQTIDPENSASSWMKATPKPIISKLQGTKDQERNRHNSDKNAQKYTILTVIKINLK